MMSKLAGLLVVIAAFASAGSVEAGHRCRSHCGDSCYAPGHIRCVPLCHTPCYTPPPVCHVPCSLPPCHPGCYPVRSRCWGGCY